MKKQLLSLSALLAVSIASAQSYIKQPDPTTYKVVEYKQNQDTGTKTEEAQPQQPAQTAQETQQPEVDANATETRAAAETKQPAREPESKVAENRKRK